MEQDQEPEDKLQRELGVFIVREKAVTHRLVNENNKLSLAIHQYFLVSQDGLTAGCSREVYDRAKPGKMLYRESYKGYTTGWIVDGKWTNRRTDEEVREHSRIIDERFAATKVKFYEKNLEHWKQLEAALPEWLQDQVESYRKEAEKDPNYSGEFEVDYWGFSVIVATLALLYYRIGDELLDYDFDTLPESKEPRALKEFAAHEGTTATQHKMAILIARRRLAKEKNNQEETKDE